MTDMCERKYSTDYKHVKINEICIANASEMHKQVKINDIMFRHFGSLMMPLSRNE